MSFFGRLLFCATQRLRDAHSMRVFAEMRSTPFLPRSEILAHQFRLLSALLADAEAHVPYYGELCRKLGVRSCDIRTLEDFAAFPVLTKDIVRECQRDLLREDVAKEKLIEGNSGGSTGVPLRFYRDRNFFDISEAGRVRNLTQCGWKPGEMVAYFWGGNDRLYRMSRLEFEVRQRLRCQYQFDPFQSGPQDMDQWLAKWHRVRPTVILGYASTIARFATHIESSGKRVTPLRGVFTTAEKLYMPQRQIISRVFNCHVHDCYGSSEIHNIGTECPQGRMHVNADFVVLEVDRSGVGPTGPAPFIVTSLVNRVMPFIRYRNEDCGELLEGSCECGSHFPLMNLSVSRISDNFILPGGRVVHGEFFTHLMYGSQGIASFQFHQTSPDLITLWIVPGPGPAEGRERAIRGAIEQVSKLAVGVRLEVRQTKAIPLSRTGKHRFTRSDVMESSVQLTANEH